VDKIVRYDKQLQAYLHVSNVQLIRQPCM